MSSSIRMQQLARLIKVKFTIDNGSSGQISGEGVVERGMIADGSLVIGSVRITLITRQTGGWAKTKVGSYLTIHGSNMRKI